MSLSPLHAQTTTNAPVAAANATSVPTPQAPDEVTDKITDLVHDGKYAEAQQLTTGLLLAYPDDQRLIKAKALLNKLLAPGGSANAVPGSSQPANDVASAQPGTNANAGQLTGMDKVEYNSLIELARQAQQNTDLEQQKVSLRQFMNESSAFLRKFPDQMLLWKIRAASALSLNDPNAGYEAGQKLLALGAADSDDPNLQQLISKLKIRGWLDQQGVADARQKIEEGKKYDWLIGTWAGTASWFSKAPFDYGQRQNNVKVEFIKSSSGVAGYSFNMNTGVRNNTPSYQYTALNSDETNCGESGRSSFSHGGDERFLLVADRQHKQRSPSTECQNWEMNLKAPNPEWEPITSYVLSNDKRAITIRKNNRGVDCTFVLTKISD
jgi:hypothetical protein